MGTRSAEVRIHGVSGTPPEATLDLAPLQEYPVTDECRRSVDRGEGRGVRVSSDPVLSGARAFSWGRLTSGRPTTALWLILLPFVLVNMAGWAGMPDVHPGGDARHESDQTGRGRGIGTRAHVALVRLTALLVTAFAVEFLFLVVVDIVGWQWLPGLLPVSVLGMEIGDGWALPVTYTAVAAAVGILFLRTHIRRRSDCPWGEVIDPPPDPAADGADPAGAVALASNQGELWNHPGIIARLRLAHLSLALAVLGGLGVLASEAPGWVVGLAAVAVFLPVAWTVVRSLDDGSRGQGPLSVFAVLGFIAALVGGWTLQATPRVIVSGEPAGALFGVRGAVIATALSGAALALGICIVQGLRWKGLPATERPPLRSVWVAPTLALMALATAAAPGAAGAFAAAEAAGGDGPLPAAGPGADWLALAYTVLIAVLLVVGIAFFLRQYASTDGDVGSRPMQALKKLLTAPAATIAWLGSLGLAGAIVAAITYNTMGIAHSPEPLGLVPQWLEVAVTFVLLAVVAGAALVFAVRPQNRGRPRSRTSRAWSVAGVLVAAVIVALIVFRWQNCCWTLGGVTVPPRNFTGLVLVTGLIGPVAALWARVVAGLRSEDVRRGVGILWDLGLFWPRWFHPFTPPTYSDQAVTWYAAYVRDQLQQHDRVVMSAHSQGTVIAASALLLLDEPEAKRVSLLTYGSPLGRLYGELFPGQVTAGMLGRIVDRLRDGRAIRWRNLHRVTDPIGGPIVGAEQDWLRNGNDRALLEAIEAVTAGPGGLSDPCAYFHSSYPREEAYEVARARLEVVDDGQAPVAATRPR